MATSFTTPGPSFCPSGYTLVPGAASNVIPPSPTPAQLAQMQAAYCQNTSGQLLENVQGTPLGIGLFFAAGFSVVFLPGLWKLLAVPMVLYGYCSMNPQACTLSL